jgi:hypothetical protein
MTCIGDAVGDVNDVFLHGRNLLPKCAVLCTVNSLDIIQKFYCHHFVVVEIQGGSNMTGTICV